MFSCRGHRWWPNRWDVPHCDGFTQGSHNYSGVGQIYQWTQTIQSQKFRCLQFSKFTCMAHMMSGTPAGWGYYIKWFNLKIFGIVLFESANKFGQLCCNYEILETPSRHWLMWHIPPIWSSHMAWQEYSQCNISTIFTQFRLQLLHQYIDHVVTITDAGPKALRYGAFLDAER